MATWDKFITKQIINAGVEEIYRCWTIPVELEKWFLRDANFKDSSGKSRSRLSQIVVGDTYLWRWHGYPDEVTEEGEILEANGKNQLKFRFGKAGIVTVKINKSQYGTEVELLQEEIPTDVQSKFNYRIGCETGWTFYLANLKSVLQGGIDLRNKQTVLRLS